MNVLRFMPHLTLGALGNDRSSTASSSRLDPCVSRCVLDPVRHFLGGSPSGTEADPFGGPDALRGEARVRAALEGSHHVVTEHHLGNLLQVVLFEGLPDAGIQ